MIESLIFESKKLFRSCVDYGFLLGIKYMFLRIRFIYFKRGMNDLMYFEYEYLKKFLLHQVDYYNSLNTINNEPPSKNVWVCWWQGEDTMPEWCKMCFARLRRTIPEGNQLTLITKDNVKDYVDIPQHVYDRLESKDLTITQFSDILREALLYFQGGLWVDASVWTMPNFYSLLDVDKEFFSVKLGYVHRPGMIGQKISDCMWSGFFMYGRKGCLVTKFAFDGMCAYYKDHVGTIDYFIQNLIIRIGYDTVPQIKLLIDAYPVNNTNLYKLPDLVYRNSEFDETIWDEMTKNTGVFKITQKRHYLDEINGQLTYFGNIKKIYNQECR